MHSETESRELDEPQWLRVVRKAYRIVDRDVLRAIDTRLRGGERLACGAGCSACCQQPVPLTPYEVMAMGWCLAGFEEHVLEAIVNASPCADGNWTCPLLVEGCCSVYEMRPIACRRYNVFGRRCSVGEDPVEVRPWDVLSPSRSAMRRAFTHLLPLAGIAQDDVGRALDGELLIKRSCELHAVDWGAVVDIVRRAYVPSAPCAREKIHAG